LPVPQDCLILSPDASKAAVYSTFFDSKDVPRMWEVGTPRPMRSLALQERKVDKMIFSPDGRTLAACSLNGELWLWEAATRQVKFVYDVKYREGISALAFSPDSRWLATATADAPVFVWDVYGRSVPRTIPPSADHAWQELGGDAGPAFH